MGRRMNDVMTGPTVCSVDGDSLVFGISFLVVLWALCSISGDDQHASNIQEVSDTK